MLQIGQACRFTNFPRSSHEFRMHSYTIPFVILKSNGTAGCPIPVRPCTPTSNSARPDTLLHPHSRATGPSTFPRVRPAPPPQPTTETPWRPFLQPPLHPCTAPDPVVVANPVAGTGTSAYPADLTPITSLSMVRSQPPFAWKLDLPGRKQAREEFMATTWEVEVETQDGPREPPHKIAFPRTITFPNPGGGWKEGETIIALYAYWLRGGHWRMDCCVQGRAGVPEGQLRRLAALPVTGVRGWRDRAEEHMSYGWLQMHTRAKEEQGWHLGEVGRAVNVDAEEGGGGGGVCQWGAL